MNENGLSPADVAAMSGNNGLGGNGAWWIILLFLFAFGGFGNGGWGNNGVAQNYTLASDFATIQRQLSDGFNSIDNALDRQNAGICDLGYTEQTLMNNLNTTFLTQANAIQSQLAQCCCDNRAAIADVNYNMAMNANATQNAINQG